MLSLTYISRAHHSAHNGSKGLTTEIVRAATKANVALEVTGALIFTTSHFAQVLEGPSLAIDKLMKKIEQDRRHSLVRVLQRRHIRARMFPEWSMAYAGGPVALDEFIANALSEGGQSAEKDELLCRLLVQFALSRKAQGKMRGPLRSAPSETANVRTGQVW